MKTNNNTQKDLVEDKEDTFVYGSFAASNIRN